MKIKIFLLGIRGKLREKELHRSQTIIHYEWVLLLLVLFVGAFSNMTTKKNTSHWILFHFHQQAENRCLSSRESSHLDEKCWRFLIMRYVWLFYLESEPWRLVFLCWIYTIFFSSEFLRFYQCILLYRNF